MSVDAAVLKRITDAVHFRQPDRVPIWEALENQAVYDHCAPGVPFPQCAAVACEKLGIDATYGCMPAVTDERVEGSVVRAGQTLWQTEPALRTMQHLRKYNPPPITDRRLEEGILADHQAMQELYGPRVLYLPQNGGWGFLPGYDAQTFTVVATALAEDMPALERLWDINVERAIARNSVAARHKLAPDPPPEGGWPHLSWCYFNNTPHDGRPIDPLVPVGRFILEADAAARLCVWIQDCDQTVVDLVGMLQADYRERHVSVYHNRGLNVWPDPGGVRAVSEDWLWQQADFRYFAGMGLKKKGARRFWQRLGFDPRLIPVLHSDVSLDDVHAVLLRAERFLTKLPAGRR